MAADDGSMRLPANLGSRMGAGALRPPLPVRRLTARAWERLRRDESGFTIVEVIVATVVLVVGLLTTFLMLNVAVHSSSDVRERENGVALARQVAEDARSIPYAQLSSSSLNSTLQGYPGLANTSGGSTWTVKRAGYTYTITDSLTGLNDPKDTTGATDVKQFTVNVSWGTFQGKTWTYSESAIISRAGQDPGLQASNLQLASPSCSTAGVQSSSCPTSAVITSAGITSLQFSVTAPTGTQNVDWYLNGVKQSSWSGSAPSSGTTWTSTSWSLSGVSDGTYTVAAAAEDSTGVDGPSVTMTVRLIRNVPSAPTVTGYGFNMNLPSGPSRAAEFQWNSNPELNVVGYDIYYNGTKICQTDLNTSYQSCGANGHSAWCVSTTQCIDLAPPDPSSSNLTYTVKALYYDANNNLQEGTGRNVTLASGNPTAPLAPALVSLSVQVQPDDSAILTWTPSVSTVNFYRIYRDGNGYTNRYDTISASSCSATACTYHDTNRTTSHQYYISAVGGTTAGANMAESPLVGPVSG
jgi:Tfp pilus assembly protein PilV